MRGTIERTVARLTYQVRRVVGHTTFSWQLWTSDIVPTLARVPRRHLVVENRLALDSFLVREGGFVLRGKGLSRHNQIFHRFS